MTLVGVYHNRLKTLNLLLDRKKEIRNYSLFAALQTAYPWKELWLISLEWLLWSCAVN